MKSRLQKRQEAIARHEQAIAGHEAVIASSTKPEIKDEHRKSIERLKTIIANTQKRTGYGA